MITLNQYITEVNDEVYDIINEVLNNDIEYTYEEICESFENYSLILEANKFSKDMEKHYKKYLKDHADINNELNEIFNKYNKKREELRDKYKGVAKFNSKTGERTSEGNEYFNKLNKLLDAEKTAEINLIKEKQEIFDSSVTLDFIFFYLTNIKKYLSNCCKVQAKKFDDIIKNAGNKKEALEQLKKFENESWTIDFKYDINFIEQLLDYLSDKHDFDISEDVSDICKKLKLPFFEFKDNKWTKSEDDILEYTTKVINKIVEKSQDKINADSDSEAAEETTSEQSTEETQEDVKDAITDNKELLTPIAKAANVTGEQLLSIITKLCKTSKGKSRKLDEGVITGLSIMICGALLAVKKNGKGDKKAIASVAEKINKVVLNSKRGVRDILK